MQGKGGKKVLSSCLHLLFTGRSVQGYKGVPSTQQHEPATELCTEDASLRCTRIGTAAPCVMPQMGNNQRSSNNRRVPGTAVHSPNEMLHSNRDEGPTATHNNRDESCKHIERKKPRSKESILDNTI